MKPEDIIKLIQANLAAGKPATQGLSSSQIKLVQQHLIDSGYQLPKSNGSSVGVDGIFGPNTKNALDKYLTSNQSAQQTPAPTVNNTTAAAAPTHVETDPYNPYDYQSAMDSLFNKPGGIQNPVEDARKADIARQVKVANNISLANKVGNMGVLGYDASQSIDQIHRSNQAVKALNGQKPNQIAVQDKNPMLQRQIYLAQLRANQGLTNGQKDFANYQGLDNFLKAKEAAATGSAGQASGYNSAVQKAILDRYKYQNQLNSINEQSRQANQGQLNHLVGQDMGENNMIRNQKMVNYNDSLNQYKMREMAAQHLGQTGRVNMRKTIGDARELAPTMVNGYGYTNNPYAQTSNVGVNVNNTTSQPPMANIYNDPQLNDIANRAYSNTYQRLNTEPNINLPNSPYGNGYNGYLPY